MLADKAFLTSLVLLRPDGRNRRPDVPEPRQRGFNRALQVRARSELAACLCTCVRLRGWNLTLVRLCAAFLRPGTNTVGTGAVRSAPCAPACPGARSAPRRVAFLPFGSVHRCAKGSDCHMTAPAFFSIFHREPAPRGDPTYASACFVEHLQLRHRFDYSTYADFGEVRASGWRRSFLRKTTARPR